MFVALDSNILIRLLNRKDTQCKEVRGAVRLLLKAGTQLCVFPQTAAEFWSVTTRPMTARGGYGMTTVAAAKRLNAFERYFTFLLDQPAQYSLWRQLVEAYRIVGHNVHDARLVAAMTAHGVSDLVTYDVQDFKRYTGITVVPPADVIARGGKI
jgi:predicted nucleic acid-binding protein